MEEYFLSQQEISSKKKRPTPKNSSMGSLFPDDNLYFVYRDRFIPNGIIQN